MQLISNQYRHRPALLKYDEYRELVEKAAYFKWLEGSDNDEQNWLEAELEIIEMLKH
jgi:hypothetical protein